MNPNPPLFLSQLKCIAAFWNATRLCQPAILDYISCPPLLRDGMQRAGPYIQYLPCATYQQMTVACSLAAPARAAITGRSNHPPSQFKSRPLCPAQLGKDADQDQLSMSFSLCSPYVLYQHQFRTEIAKIHPVQAFPIHLNPTPHSLSVTTEMYCGIFECDALLPACHTWLYQLSSLTWEMACRELAPIYLPCATYQQLKWTVARSLAAPARAASTGRS